MQAFFEYVSSIRVGERAWYGWPFLKIYGWTEVSSRKEKKWRRERGGAEEEEKESETEEEDNQNKKDEDDYDGGDEND